MFVEFIYINIYENSTTPKRHVETLRNWNIPFQLKKQNTYQNGIDNLDLIAVQQCTNVWLPLDDA